MQGTRKVEYTLSLTEREMLDLVDAVNMLTRNKEYVPAEQIQRASDLREALSTIMVHGVPF